ncbi:hypothetical protein P4H82_28005 [Bacillus cereus]|nr:hypothetical protein [Bacillus cereus]MEB9190635.1 hypothetical protein [Bacillus cereus]
MLGVFKMNDYDWVCAPTERQAKRFYIEDVGISREDMEEDYFGEVPLTDTMLFHEEDVPELDEKMYNFTKEFWYGEEYYRVPFWYVILQMGTGEPYLIASTEAM